jgi:hypothetical protein
MYPDGWDVVRCLDTYPLAGGMQRSTDGASYMNKRQGFSPGALPSIEFEGIECSVMMIAVSDAGT